MERPRKIRLPRAGSTPLTRQHKRLLAYAFGFIALFSLWYVFAGKPIDRLDFPFEQHEAWMKDRSGVGTFVAKDSYDWRKAPFYNKVDSYTKLPVGRPNTLPPVQAEFPVETKAQRALRQQRRTAVRNEFERSWAAYKDRAWTHDELMPTTGQASDPFGGWGATLVDSLDALWMMGFKDDFYEAVGAVAKIDFGNSSIPGISVFETTIRYLGGLLSAYDLSHEKVLLEKSVQIGEMLYRAFDTPNNTPADRLYLEAVKLATSTGSPVEYSICLANFGSLTMEFTRLAQLTQEPKYYDAVARVTDILDRGQNTTRIPGLFPIWVNAREQSIAKDPTFTLGAMADSTYEYFPKMHALLGGREPVYQKLYQDSAPMIDKHLLYRPMLPDDQPGSDILFSGDIHISDASDVHVDAEMQHLTCFIGGFFALAGRLFQRSHDVDLGRKLTAGCIYAYKALPTGIMPEIFSSIACASRTSCPWNQTLYEAEVLRKAYGKDHADYEAAVTEQRLPPGFIQMRDKRYLLRPEAIESVFVLYRVTADRKYLDDAWDMFSAIRKYSRTRYANGQVFDVTDDEEPVVSPEDKMESFWLAETLKYFYLIFSPSDMVSLDEWVLNTEAHPFRRPVLRETVRGVGA
ncbi:class I alpha-mannosidase [Polyplosphaeria fusca]|uniref:alpha-1,2-Mannosidase n=1 Tax=Polyplosphaeria fusca TaxID=682080 RepID=A0A9P4QKR9_9PLEO|nr:class I alpha-mannosidase [Polyplosphaeria fusca]